MVGKLNRWKKKLDGKKENDSPSKNGKMEKRKKLGKIWNSKKALIGTPEISDPKYSIK